MMTNDVERLRARANKQEVMDAETKPHRWRRRKAEKADSITRLRGLPRPEAEHEAFEHVVVEYLNETHPNSDPTRCAHCRGPHDAS